MPYTSQTPSGKEQNQRRSLGDLWRVKQSGGPLELGTGWGPRQEVFTPYRDPYGPGLQASVAAAVRHRHRVLAVRATARCSAVPGAPACLCAARGQ